MRRSVVWFTRSVAVVVRALLVVVYRLRIRGGERIPARGGVLLAANHASFLDPPLLQVSSRRLVVFTPRTTLDRSRLYRWLTGLCAVVPIRRGEADLGATRQILALLEQGEVVALFPEETRSRNGRVGEIKGGFHLLARKARVPVVPVYIEGTFDAWPRHRKWPRLGPRIQVRCGPPLTVWDMTRERAVVELRGAWQRLGAVVEPAPS